MNSAEPAYARTGAFRDSGIPGIPRAVAPQYKIIPNALARIFRRRSTIIATGLLALAAFAMMPVDNAEAQTTTLMITTGALDSSDGSVGVTEGETAGEKFTLNMTNAGRAVAMRLRIEGVGMTLPTMTNREAIFPNGWTLSHNAPTNCTPTDSNPSNGCVTGQSTSSGTHAVRLPSARGAPRVFEDRDYVDVIWNLSRIGDTSITTRFFTFTLKSRAGATGNYFAPQTATGGLRVNPTQVNDRKWRFKRIATPVLTTSFARVNGVDDSILRERDPYSNPSGTNNDTPGDTATVIMDLTHFPTPLPSVSGDPIAATINFTISGTADGPGLDNGTNDFRVSPTNTSNPEGLIWSAIDSNGRGTVEVKRSLIQGTGNNSRPPSPGRLDVPGAANTLNSNESAQIRLRFEPHNNRDTSVENIVFTVNSVRVHSTNSNLPAQNIINRAKMQDHDQVMTIQPSGQANVKLAALDSTGVIHTDGEEKRFTVELGGINPDTAGLTGVRVNLSIAGTANRGFTLRPPQGVGTPHIIETGDYSITLPAILGRPVILPVIGNNPARVSFTVPVARFMENEGTDPDIGEETITLILTARVDGILENTERTITISLNTTGAKAELVNSGIQIGDDIPETSDTTGTVLAYNTRRRTPVASLSGGGVNLHALGTNADTNSGTFTFRVEHYNHAISDAAHEETSDYMYVRIDMVPTGSPVGLDTPPPTKFVNSGDTRMITSGDYTISIPNNTSGVEIIPLTNEEAAFRLRIPLTRFNASDTANGTIATRGAEEVIMTVRANDVLPTRRQTTTFSINNVIEFDEHRLPESPFLRETAFQRANGNFGNDEVTFNLLLPEGLQSWIIDGPVDEVTEGAQFDPSTGPDIDRAFHVGTLFMTGGRNAGYVRTTLTGTVPTGELTIGPDVDFNVQLSLLSPSDGSRNNRRDAFSPHMLANGNRESGFNNTGSTATKTLCFGLSASGNITREFWAARTDGIFPQPDMDVTLAVTNIQPLQVTGGTLSASQLKSQCEDLPRVSVDTAPSIDARDTAEFTMLDNGDLERYLRVAIEPLGTPAGEIDRTMPVEGNQFERPLRIKITPTDSQMAAYNLTHVKFKLHARVESGGLTANNEAEGDRPPAAANPLADFTLLLSGTVGSARSSLIAKDILSFRGFGNELVADVCRLMDGAELYNRHLWLLPRAANSIADGDKVINFFITDLFFPGPRGGGDAREPCDADNPRTIDNGRLTGTQTYPFLAGPSITIRDGPLVPVFTGGNPALGGDPALEFAGNPSSASADFDTITLNLDYEEHIRDRVVQNPGVALAGVTHFVYVSSTNTTTVKRCSAGGSGTDIADNTEIPIANLGLDCDDPNNNGKGFVVEGMDRSADGGDQSVINFRLRNRRNIGTQPVRTTVNSVPATLTFVDAQATNPGIRKLTVGGVTLEPLPTEAPFAVTATLQPEATRPTVRVVPVDHHSTVNIAGEAVGVVATLGNPDERSAARTFKVTSGEPFDITITTERGDTRTYSVTPIVRASGNDNPGINEITATVGEAAFHIELNQVSSTGTVILPATTTADDSVRIAVVPAESGSTVRVSDIHDRNLAPDAIEYHDTAPGLSDDFYDITDFSTGESLFSISVADEGTARIYTITVTVPSTDAQLDETLTVDGFDISLDDGTSTGSVTVRDGTRVAVISASPADARATITAISGPDGAETVTPNDDGTFTADVSGLTVGTNEFTITVSPEDTDTADRIYTITVIVPANGASLSSLNVGGQILTLNANDPFEVDVNLGAGINATDVEATAINDTVCTFDGDGVINNSCTTITIGRTDSEETVIDASVQVASGSSYPLSSLNDGDTITIVVTNISAADVVTTRTYLINLIIPAGAGADNSFRRITVANRSVSGSSVVIAGGLTEGVVVVTPTQNFTDARGAIITDITGTDTNGGPLTGGFTGESTPRGERETTIRGFLLGRNQISVTIQAVNGDIAIHNIRVTVPFSPPHDDSLASINGLTVNGAVVILDHDNNTGTVDLPTGTERATVIATPSQNATDAHGAIVTAITGTASNRTTALGSDQESNTARGPLIATLTGLTPDNNAPNTIVVMVSSPNGVRTRTYTITVTIPAALSENTLLSTVTLTPLGGDPVIADLDLSAGTGTAELPVGTTAAGLRVNLADIRSTVSDISGTNADGDDLTGVSLGSETVPGDRAVQISNFVIGEDNTIMITVTPQAGAMRTYEILVEIDPVPTGVLTASNPLNLDNNTTDAGTFTLALNGIPSTVNNGTDDVILTAVDVFFAFTISSTGDGDFDTIANNSQSVETDDFSLSANGGARFYPASAIVGGGSTDGFVLRVPGTRFNVGAGSPTTHSAETITFTVTTKEITTENLQNLPYSISFANSHVAWRTAAGPIADSNLAGPDIANFSGATNVFNIDSDLGEDAALDRLAIAPEPTEGNSFVDVALSPSFETGVFTYSTAVALPLGTTAVRITARAINLGTTVINGCLGSDSCSTQGTIPLTVNGNIVSGLAPGDNTIEVVVTSENRANNQTYTITAVVDGVVSSTRINRASFAVPGNPVPEEATLTDGPNNNNGSGTVEIGNTTTATISVVPLTTDIVTSITNPDGTAATFTSSNPYNATLTGFTTGANEITVTVQKSGNTSITRTYTIAVTVRPAPTAAITTIGGASHTFEEGAGTLVRVADFAVDMGAFHAGKCLSATINASSTSNITGSGTNGEDGDFVFYIVDQSVLGGGSAPGDAVPQGFSDGSETARTNGVSIILNSNGQGSRSFYVGPRSNNSTIDGDKVIDFGITDPKVHVTGCSGFLNPGTPNARTPDGSGDIPETGTIIASTALAVSGTFMIISHDDESGGRNPTGAADPTSITSIGTERAVTITEGTTGNVEITFDAPIPLGRSVAYTLTPFIDNNIAASNSDYTATNTVDLTLVGVSGSTYTFPVATTPDRIIENNEEATLTITNVIWTGGNFEPPDDPNRAATLTITDSAVATDFVVSFVGNVAGSESGTITAMLEGTAAAGVTLGTVGRPVRVLVSTRDGTATEPADYAELIDVPVVFTAGGVAGRKSVSITPVDDGIVETNETLELTVRTTDPAATASGTATVTINNDDALTNVRFFPAPADSVSEGDGDGTVTYTVQATGTLERTVRIPFTVTPGTAQTPQDYTVEPASPLVLNPGTNPSATIRIAIVDDGTAEPSQDLIVALPGGGDDAALYGLSTTSTETSHTLTITDNDRATGFTVSAADAEEGDDSTVTVTLNGPLPDGTVTFDYALTGASTATTTDNADPEDYADDMTGATPTVAGNRESFTFNVATVNDTRIENTQGVQVTVSNISVSGTTIAGPVSGTFNIEDNEPNTAFDVFFAARGVRGNENGADIPAALTGKAAAGVTLERDINVLVTSGDSSPVSATAGEDYVIVSETVTFEFGDYGTAGATGTKNIVVDPVGGILVEADETLELTATITEGTEASASVELARNRITVTIVNDDFLEDVQFALETSEVEETDVDFTHPITVTATGAIAPGFRVEVPFTVGGTATRGTDYAIANLVATLTADNILRGADIIVDIISNPGVEPTEDVILTLSAPTGPYTLSTTPPLKRVHTLRITDADTSGVTIAPTGGEEAGLAPGTFVVGFTNPPPDEMATVTYALSSNNESARGPNYTMTAEEGSNITSLSTGATGTFVIAANSSGTLTVTPVNDDDIYDENITLTISGVVFSSHTINSTPAGTLTLTDDDELTVGFELAESTLEEDDGMGVTLTVGGGTVIDNRGIPIVTVMPTAGGTDPATPATDYDADGTDVPINAAARTATTNAVTIPIPLDDIIIGDMAVEADETVILNLNATTTEQHEADISITGLAATTTTIMDVPPALTVALTAPATIAENEGPLIGTLTATAVGGGSFTLERAVKVRVFTTAGTATAGSDFTAIPDGHSSGDVNIGPDTTAASRFTATTEITIIDDTVAEALEEETFTLTLAEASPSDRAVTALGVSTARVTITDNDRAMSVSGVMAEDVEEGANSTVTVNNDVTVHLNGALPVDSTVSFNYAITTNDGVDGVNRVESDDVAAVAGTQITNPATIAENRRSFTFTVGIRGDDAIEDTETVQVTVSNIMAGDLNITDGTGSFTVADNEPTSAFTVSFVGDSMGDEDGANIPTTLQGVASADVTLERNIDVLVASGGAGDTATIADSDYTALDGTTGVVTFLASEHGTAAETSTKTIEINPTVDAVVEPNETLTLTVSTSDTAAAASGTAIVTILDDDDLTVQFAAETSTFAENSRPPTHNIVVNATGTLAAGHMIDVSFEVDLTNSTATPGTGTNDDYTRITNFTVTLAARSNPVVNPTAMIPIVIRDNPDLVETDETIILILTDSETDNDYVLIGDEDDPSRKHTLTIIDDSTIQVRFDPTEDISDPTEDIQVTEGVTSQTTITVRTVGTIAPDHFVDVFFTVGGSAKRLTSGTVNAPVPSDADYAITELMVRLEPGINPTATFTVTIIDNDIVEPNKDIVLTLTDSAHSADNPRPYEVRNSHRTRTITITDSDTITVQFDPADSRMPESVTSRTVTVTATGDIASGLMIDVPFTVGVGSPAATLGTDNETIDTLMVTFDSGNLSREISVTIINDNIAEPNEEIVLTLTAPAQGADYRLGANTGHTLTIEDDDALRVRFEQPPQANNSSMENNSGMQTIDIITEGTLPRDIVVPFTVATGGTNATRNTDYMGLPSMFTLRTGVNNQTATITFNITDDDLVEPDETIILTLMDSETGDGILYNPVETGNQHIFTFTITDNDNISVEFEDAESSMAESVSPRNIAVTATGTIAANHPGVEVGFTVGGNAISTPGPDNDYTAINPLMVTLSAGVNPSADISVTIRDDDNDEEDDETIILTLSEPPTQGADYMLVTGGNTQHTLFIENASDDDSLMSLTVDGVDVIGLSEGDGTTGSVRLRHAIMHVPVEATATDTGATILSIAGRQDFSTDPGHTATLMNVFVRDGRTFTVVVQAENGDDPRTYTIEVSVPDTPRDTSQLRPMVTVSPTTRTIPETNGEVTIVVRLNRPVSTPVSLPFTITATDADADDYAIGFPPNCDDCDEVMGGDLVFSANQQRREITFAATTDFEPEDDQVILFKLNAGTRGAGAGAVIVPITAESTITIRDDDTPPTEVSVSASRTRVREDAGTSVITVSLDSAAITGAPITLPFTFSDDSATFGDNADDPGADYFATCPGATNNDDPVPCLISGMLTFAPGDRIKTITVTGIDDTPEDPEEEDTEEDETILFKLASGLRGTVTVASADEVTLTLATNVTDTMETMRDVEVVTSLTGIKQVGMITGLIRQRFSDTVPAPSFGDIGSGTSGSGSTLNANAIADDPDFGAPSFSMDLPDNPENLGDLLNGFGFNTQARADAGGVWSMWVRGQYTSMDGSTTQENPAEDINPTLSYDGSATGVGLGMEWAGETTIIGIAADYITTVLDISTTSENITLSKYKETILLAAPYFALRRAKSHSFWMSLGVGTGTANATLDGTTRSADVKAGFANAGIDITVGGDAHEFVAGLSGSAIRKETDPFTFDNAVIPKVTTDSFQARGDITYAHTIGVGGGSMRPYIGLSTIHDFGDTPSDDEHALGLRSGITFSGLNLDLNLEGSTEILRDDHKQWTISGNARFHSNPDNSGLSLSLDGSRGGEVGAGIEGSYGLPIRRFHPDAMLTPFAALRREDDGNEVVSGMRFSIGDDLDIDLQNTRRPHDDNETAVNLRFHREF